ncbi:MAG: SpoIIE family protein phosphatase [Bacteroidia bacterium]
MRRWGLAEYLGIGLAALILILGGLFLIGIWIITQRDTALLTSSPTWEKWDKLFLLWVYGILLGLFLIPLGLGLWWWQHIARSVLRVRDKLRALLYEGTVAMPLPKAPTEIADIWRYIESLEETGRFLNEVVSGKRQSNSPASAEWPPLVRSLALQILEELTTARRERHELQELLSEGLKLLELAQRAPNKEAYLAQAGPRFLAYAGAAMGAFYRLEGSQLRRLYAYAYPLSAPSVLELGEGWIGQVAREGSLIWLREVPAPYQTALSGLGGAAPTALAIMPVIAGQTIRGVWDIAAFSEWEPHRMRLTERLLIFFSLGYMLQEEAEGQRTLQEKLQAQQAAQHELATQLDQLRSELVSLQETHTTLQHKLREAQTQAEALSRKFHLERERWNNLVEHLSEAVVLFDSTGRPRYMSPTTFRLLGYSENELHVFFRAVERTDIEAVHTYFQQLRTTSETLRLRFRYRHGAGHTLWLEAVGKNYLQDPSLEGILLVLRDITDEVEYEKQYRTRLKFQSLVENSPDIIFRVDRTGQFLYINPTIERYTSYAPTHYIRNTIYSVGFSLEEVRFWEHFIHLVLDGMAVQSAEVDFPSVFGVRRMAVRGIPEPGPEGEVETAVILLQDITELRQAQEQLRLQNERLEQARRTLESQKKELEEKNRDIMESISYARRIQGALLPGEAGLRQLFPDSFLLHWLRDVVGGDFYWYGEVEGQKVVVVVDCTGHGVPGAFMTFLGYTLLEAAIRERRLLDPAQILSFMDRRLRELLAGQETMQDGMDVALCVVDTQRQVLRFAGAHRPLLLYREGRWQLLPGAPTGLGGATWLDSVKAFHTHTLTFEKGDQLYLYTDGYLDQFSADGQRRYSHRRFRNFLMTWGHLPMEEQHKLLLEELRQWMGNTHPTDDITVIGLRL